MTPNQVNSITILQTNQLGSKISKGINSEFVCAFLGLQLEVKPSQAVVEHTCLIPAWGGGRSEFKASLFYNLFYKWLQGLHRETLLGVEGWGLGSWARKYINTCAISSAS